MVGSDSQNNNGTVEEITLQFPATSGYLALCRVNAATVGSMLGFDLDALDDLRLAVNESVSWLLKDVAAGAEPGLMKLKLSAASGQLNFRAERVESGLPDLPVDDLVEAILGATVDSYSTSTSEHERHVSFSKSVSDE